MKKLILIAMIAVVVVAGTAAVRSAGRNVASDITSGSSGQAARAAQQPVDSRPTEGIVTPIARDGVKKVIVTANDRDASPNTINVNRGDRVVITFKVSGKGSTRGALVFRSVDPPVESDAIGPGSTGDVTFTATKSFDFTPYWPQSGAQSDYTVSVKVL